MSSDKTLQWQKPTKKEKQKKNIVTKCEIRFMHLSSYSTPKIRGRLVIVNVNSSLLFCELFPIYTLALSADAKSAKIEHCILHKQMATNFICSIFFKHMSHIYVPHLLICYKSAFMLPNGIKPIKTACFSLHFTFQTLQTIVLHNIKLFLDRIKQ